MKLFSRRKGIRIAPAEEGRYRYMSPEEKAEYDAYVEGLPPGSTVFWANSIVEPDGRNVPIGPGGKWANKARREPWHGWADEALDG